MKPAPILRPLAAAALLAGLAALHPSAGTEEKPAARPIPPHAAYLQPVPGLTPEQQQTFRAGEKVFNNFWIAIPNDVISQWWDLSQPGPGGGGWGLGPTFVATSCVSCHVQAGRGRVPDKGTGPLFQQALRLSVPGDGPHGGPNPDPHYGTQLQPFDIIKSKDQTRQAGEGEVHIDWRTRRFRFADGETVELRQPAIRIEKLNYGPLAPGVMTSLRNTQAIVGLGYLEAVSEEDILALAALQKSQGLNGRPNYVRDDINDRIALGRFGWKANQPSLRQQIAGAFHSDIGITSSLYREQNCPAVQKDCHLEKNPEKPEVSDELWQQVAFWAMSLDAPAPVGTASPAVQRGEKLFHAATCAQCHVPELKTGAFPELPALAHKRIRPYTDLLLHDMGPDLADGRPDFRAGGADWRTPPLWGIGRSKQVNGSTHFLHDGRARNLVEAILWHGGEATAAREHFAKLSKKEREELIAFLEAL
ncbi:MAG: c-type cytochrome [Burkholderiaceae bacterium]|nr:c-type cytochrome [Burkholderiaceae bacterium]